jgi:hypothetical protein
MPARADLAPVQRGAQQINGVPGNGHLRLVDGLPKAVIVGPVKPDPRGSTGPNPRQREIFERQLIQLGGIGITKPAGLVIREAADGSGRLHPVWYFNVKGREEEVKDIVTPGQLRNGEAVLIDGATEGLAYGPVEDQALVHTIFTERLSAFSGRRQESDNRKNGSR